MNMKKILCIIGKHQYEQIARPTDRGYMIGCKRCRKVWGMNTDVQIMLPWSLEMSDMYRRLHYSEYQNALKAYDKWKLEE